VKKSRDRRHDMGLIIDEKDNFGGKCTGLMVLSRFGRTWFDIVWIAG
jgi:hypothetical protein